MGAGQISVSHYNDENGSRTAGEQHSLPPRCFYSPKASRTQGPCARENIRPHKKSK